jgi:hypothetical protein
MYVMMCTYIGVGPNGLCAVEEESMESGSFSMGQRTASQRSSFSSENTTEDYNSFRKKRLKDKKPGSGLLGFLRYVLPPVSVMCSRWN